MDFQGSHFKSVPSEIVFRVRHISAKMFLEAVLLTT